jgi:thiol-disulfide isomerase/thioredoxin
MPTGSWLDKHANTFANLSNVCVVLLCLSGLAIVARNWIAPRQSHPGIHVTRPAAGFTPPIDFSKNRHTVLVAISSHCEVCETDIPNYQALERSVQNDFKVVYITSDDEKAAGDFFRRNGLRGPVLFSQRFANYGIQKAPTVQIVDTNGVISHLFNGNLTLGEKEILHATLQYAR